MTESTADPETTEQPDPQAFERFAEVARKVFAAPRDEVEKRIERATKKRKSKRERKKKAA